MLNVAAQGFALLNESVSVVLVVVVVVVSCVRPCVSGLPEIDRPPALLIERIRTAQRERRRIRHWVAFPAAFRPDGIDTKFPVAAALN
uniref:Secreted protein n=1 Tax=Plectus sambesii TaxID=2011161 RepID=A0A914WW90_9BILA